MKVTVLDDYQRAFEHTDAIKRLSRRVEVEILTEKLPTEDAAVSALKGSQAIIPIRERTKFTASLLKALSDLEYISQTGSHVYHVDMEAATRLGIVSPSCAKYRTAIAPCDALNGRSSWAMC
jgi:D-3-phosphoglycerate dehydrogenase